MRKAFFVEWRDNILENVVVVLCTAVIFGVIVGIIAEIAWCIDNSEPTWKVLAIIAVIGLVVISIPLRGSPENHRS